MGSGSWARSQGNIVLFGDLSFLLPYQEQTTVHRSHQIIQHICG